MKTVRRSIHNQFCQLLVIMGFATGGAVFGAQNTVVVWGSGAVTNVPADVTNVATVTAVGNACFAVLRDGRMRAWGFGFSTNIPSSATDVVAVAPSSYWWALRRDGIVVNYQGVAVATNGVALAATSQGPGFVLRGDGTVTAADGRNSTFSSNVVAIAGGGYDWPRRLFFDGSVSFELFITSNHIVAVADSSYPVALQDDGTVVVGSGWPKPSGLSNVVAVAAGGGHGLALTRDGLVVAWGNNTYGQINVPTGLSNVVAIAAGGYHSLALKADGKVVAWGDNTSGQTDVPPGLTNVAAIFAGPNYSVAIVGASPPTMLTQPPDETVWAGQPATFTVRAIGTAPLRFQWQLNGEFIEGATNSWYRIDRAFASHAGSYSVIVSNPRGTAASRESQLKVRANPGILAQPTNQASLFGGNAVLRVTVESQTAVSYQWFFNGAVLGGATQPNLTLSDLSAADAGNYWCVASNGFSQATSSVARVIVTLPVQPTNQVSWLGGSVSFTATHASTKPVTFEWFSQSGPVIGATGPTLALTNLSLNQAGDYWAVANAAFGNCTSAVVRLSINGIATWGNSFGYGVPASLQSVNAIGTGWYHYFTRRGDGTSTVWGLYDNGGGGLSTAMIPAGLTNIVSMSGGAAHSLALLADGNVAVWGSSYYGIPNIPAGITNAVAVAAGTFHCLVLGADGHVWAWGDNTYGETAVPLGLNQVVCISALGFHSLALRSDGRVVAWGLNDYGQANIPSGLSNVVAVAAGNEHSVALRDDGSIAVWGRNQFGQTNVPSGLSNVVAVAAGFYHTLALRSDGTLVAWGWNDDGQTNVPASLPNVVAIAAGGYYNLAIVSAGLVAAPVQMTASAWTNHVFSTSVQTVRGKSYYLQHRDSLTTPKWIMPPPFPGDGNARTLVDPRAAVPQRFYRVWQKP